MGILIFFFFLSNFGLLNFSSGLMPTYIYICVCTYVCSLV